ncbi:hypothetical protein BP6252_06002 [Coleophoma cylindrospora]|uniref:Major facilitator superfamily (MFS) profile domain-containing protein n=1 Tax=Coleophoma cylindrospora TaxID=1849047 RepID=A0A3D8RLN1_9HELO|nr:hypothetical protein BP6252_06002 [Coleophoma cylindrospora]
MGTNIDKGGVINLYNIFILFFVGLGSMSYGYAASVISITLGQPSFSDYFNLATAKNGTDLEATMNGLFQAGGVVGVLFLPFFADKYGRKMAIAWSAILLIFSGAFLGGSVNIGEFIFFRFISGAGAFSILAAVPIWMNEVVPARLRGGLVTLHAVLLVTGYASAAWVGVGFFFWQDPKGRQWRPPLALQCVWPLLLLSGLYWIPESPRWLVSKGRTAEARTILERLHSDKKDNLHSYALKEFYQIQKQVDIENTLQGSWLHIFKKPSYRRRAFLAIATTFFVQCSGVLVINNYGPTLYKTLGYTTVMQLIYPSIWLTVGIVFTALAIPLVDRFPRPKYMACGIAGCMVTLACEAAIVARFVPSQNFPALRAGVAMLFVFEVFYAVFLDGTQFGYLGELFPTHIRAKGICLGVATISLTNIMWLQSAPTAFITIGWKFYLVLIIPGTIGSVIMFFFFPDTNGLPLEEIAAIFGDADEVAVYQRDIDMNDIAIGAVGHHMDAHTSSKASISQVEQAVVAYTTPGNTTNV